MSQIGGKRRESSSRTSDIDARAKRSKTAKLDRNEDLDVTNMLELSLSQVSIKTSVNIRGREDPPSCSESEDEQSQKEDNVSRTADRNNEVLNNDGDIVESENDLQKKINQMPLIDGKFFTVDMEKTMLGGAISAYCNFCSDRKLFVCSFRSTSNFTTHLKRKHQEAHEQYKEYCKVKREGRNDSAVDRKRWSAIFSQRKFEENIANLVLKFMLPFRIVEDSTFRKMFDDFRIEKGDLKIRHLTRYSLGKLVENNLKATMDEIREYITLLIAAGGQVCTTADVWTGGARRFLGVTVSWIEPETLQRKSAAIACKRFPGTHSFDAIAHLLSTIHLSFGLTPELITATVTDNASNFEKAFRMMGIEESDNISSDEFHELGDSVDGPFDVSEFSVNLNSEDNIILEEEFCNECARVLPRHLKCASHTLNLIASTDIARAVAKNEPLKRKHNSVTQKCSSLLRCLRSPKKREVITAELGVAIQRPVVTRWNSCYDFFKQLISIKEQLMDQNFEGLTGTFTIADFNYLSEYVRCTTPLANAIDTLQGDKCYYGILLPTLVSIKCRMKDLQKCDDIVYCKPLINIIIEKVNVRFERLFDFNETRVDAAIAAISHPRFKGRWLAPFSEIEQKTIHRRFIDAVSSETLVERFETPQENDDDEFQFGTGMIHEFEQSSSQGEIMAEVTRYLKTKETELEMLKKFPTIRKTFLKYNTSLPSSAPVERLFSYATMINAPKFNRLTENHFEQRILAKANAEKKYI